MPKFELKIIGDSLEDVLSALNTGTVSAMTVTATDEDAGPVNSNAPAVDNEGLPWDARIHSANKAVTGTGTWRKRRGVDDATYAAVIQQLRSGAGMQALQAAPVATAPVAGIPMPAAAAPVPTLAPVMAAPVASAAPSIVSAPVASPVAAPALAPAGNPSTDYQPFMGTVSLGMQAGRIDAPYLMQLAQRLGITSITDLMSRPELIPTAYATLQAEGKLG